MAKQAEHGSVSTTNSKGVTTTKSVPMQVKNGSLQPDDQSPDNAVKQ